MNYLIIEEMKKDNLYQYLKENSNYIKDFERGNITYKEFKNIIKDKYHLNLTDKVSNIIDDIELVGSILNTIK